ncbi:MAG: hypothetical protein KBA06_00180 [Saprospiraceae bacterium]|nr:hypothetical protein [Saprospiraceae bacterium]
MNTFIITIMLLKRFLLITPSCSGVSIIDDNVYVVSDNSAYLHVYDKDGIYKDKILIFKQFAIDSIIEKKLKPDLELMTNFKHYDKDVIMLCGSGSYHKVRDTLVWVTIDNEKSSKTYSNESYSLTTLYDAWRKDVDITLHTDLNLEGLASDDTYFYFFQRGNVNGDNILFRVRKEAFVNYILDTNRTLPLYDTFRIKLPTLEGYYAGFSDATMAPDGKNIIFTASVEGSNNSYDDGVIFGSFIGILPLADLKDGYEPTAKLLTDNGRTLKIKVEGVAVKKVEEDGKLHLILLTDPDGSHSEWLEILMQY